MVKKRFLILSEVSRHTGSVKDMINTLAKKLKKIEYNTIEKIQLKCHGIDDSVVNVFRQTIFFSFVKPPGYKVFCHSETVH